MFLCSGERVGRQLVSWIRQKETFSHDQFSEWKQQFLRNYSSWCTPHFHLRAGTHLVSKILYYSFHVKQRTKSINHAVLNNKYNENLYKILHKTKSLLLIMKLTSTIKIQHTCMGALVLLKVTSLTELFAAKWTGEALCFFTVYFHMVT